MISKPSFATAILVAIFTSAAAQADPPPTRIVMTWVPPYAVDQCRARLDEDAGGLGPRHVLTHLTLQFWLPTRDGGVEKTQRYGEISDGKIIAFRDWAHAHGIRVLLCVYNSVDAWDWSLAQAGFADHREAFVAALVVETQRLGLDGVDVDLEGNGEFDSSKDAFVAFVRELSGKLRAHGEQLTVDSFAYKWNAPNQTWWSELFPLVDGINTMGYEQIGANGAEWRACGAQRTAAGPNAAKLLIGFPGDKAEWLGNTAAEHLEWLARDPGVGVAIWDAQFEAPFWRTASPWKALARIKKGRD